MTAIMSLSPPRGRSFSGTTVRFGIPWARHYGRVMAAYGPVFT